MDRLQPFEKLDEDEYYMGTDGWRAEDSGDDMSSDDELQAELRKIAGIRTKCDKKRDEPHSEFEDDMEGQLDRSICDYADLHMGRKETSNELAIKDVQMTETKPSGSKNDEDENPIRKLADKAKKANEQEEKEVGFYDPDEDDNNEKWVEEHSKQAKGSGSSKAKGKIDNDSDAVLSCPGCMNLLTRDCQRHELYKDQYRAMFVENCAVDTAEKLTIEKSGKEMRRQRQKQKKTGFMETIASTNDLFHPVRCQNCKTKVAVMDNDEVYHFFNVLSGYA